MSFAAPEWFFLLPAIVAMGWRWRRLRLHEPLRAVAVVLLLLILVEPRIRLAAGGLDLWVLADRSDSVAGEMARQSREIDAILNKSRGGDDRVFYIDYAGETVRRGLGDPVFEGQTYQTRTGDALQYALGQLEQNRAARLLVLTDGYATEPLGSAAEQVMRSRVPLDYLILGDTATGDWRVVGLNVPTRVLSGESFLVEIRIAGPGEATVPWEVLRSGQVVKSGTTRLSAGSGLIQLTDRIATGGAVDYEVRLRPEADVHPENNRASSWVEVTAGPAVLLLSPYRDDPLVPLLESQGLEVRRVEDPSGLDAGSLAGIRTVIFNNMPASRVPNPFFAALDFFVREQGGGVLMAGGRNSFGSGGYYASALDPLLPVSLESKNEQRKSTVALAVNMDRSGSMRSSTPSGYIKMDLANSGAARVVELLADGDSVAVHATDRFSHQIVPLTAVGPVRTSLLAQVRGVQSTGGGIVVMEALQAAWDELKKSTASTRHIILFADANDSGQGLGDYPSLVRAIRADNITITTIGMGHATDRWGPLLAEIGNLGGGRVFFSADAADLPAVFAQETVSVARSSFVRDPAPTAGLAGWAEISASPPNWMSQVAGYNLMELRPDATASLMTTDENRAPLVASWKRGAGRVGIAAFPLAGDDSVSARSWAGYSAFVQTFVRWIGGEDIPAGLTLRPTVHGDRLVLDLFYDESMHASVASVPPTALVAESVEGRTALEQRPLTWEKLEPGQFRATSALVPGRVVRGAVRVGDVALPFGPIAVAGSTEWSFDPDRRAELRDLSARTGGSERIDLAQVWSAPRPIAWRDIRSWLLVAWLSVLVLEAALTRLGISLLKRSRPPAPVR